MKYMIGVICLAITVFSAGARSADGEALAEPVTAALSGATRALLIREMQALDGAMGRIHQGLVSGDHETVAHEAMKIHDSFVLAQEITEAQREEIHHKLPGPFLAADRAFHQLAARLADAARHGDARLGRLWFQEMTRACQECHVDYAVARFPGLAPAESDDRH